MALNVPRSIVLTTEKEASNEFVYFKYNGVVHGIRARRIMELMDEYCNKFYGPNFRDTPSWQLRGKYNFTCNNSRKRTEYIINNK